MSIIFDAHSLEVMPTLSELTWSGAIRATVKAGALPVVTRGRSQKELASAETRSGHQPWIEQFREQLKPIRQLKDGWAGPNSKAPANGVYYAAEHYLALALARIPFPLLPQAVPSADGGLQLEWNRANVELEFFIDPNGRTTAVVEDLVQNVELAEEGNAALDLLLRWAPRAAQAHRYVGDDKVPPNASPFLLAA